MRDRRLVHRLRHGDADALRQIYHRYKEDLLTVAMSLLGDVHAAEDCVHDVFVHFAEAPTDLRASRNLRGYLVRCVANRAKNMLKRRQLSPEPPLEEPQSSECPVRGSMASEASKRVFEALARHRAGMQLEYGKTTPERLAEAVLANIGGEVRYPPIAADGAKNAAELLCSLL